MLFQAGAYLALGGGHLCEQSLGNFGPLHLLLDLIVDVGGDVEDGALGFAVPLAGQRRRFHLVFNTQLLTGLSHRSGYTGSADIAPVLPGNKTSSNRWYYFEQRKVRLNNDFSIDDFIFPALKRA